MNRRLILSGIIAAIGLPSRLLPRWGRCTDMPEFDVTVCRGQLGRDGRRCRFLIQTTDADIPVSFDVTSSGIGRVDGLFPA